MKKRRIKIFVILIVTLSAIPNASGQWENVGLFGHSSYLVFSGSNLFAGEGLGPMHPTEIYHSTDSGASWNQIGKPPDSIIYLGFLGAVNTILFVADHRDDSIFRSTDYGRTWSGCSIVADFMTFATLGGNGSPVMIFASTFSGVYFSSDTGNSWIAARDSGLEVTHDWVNTFTMFGGDLYAGENFSGIFVSTDSGNSWKPRNNGLMAIPNVTAFATQGTELFAGIGIGPSLTGGVFLSTDSGNSWESASNGLLSSINISALVISGNSIFAAAWSGDSGIFLSADNGMNWTDISRGLSNRSVGSVAVADGFLFAATDSGIWRRPLSDFNQSGVETNATSNSSTAIQVFPNPASDVLQVMGENQWGTVRLFDLIGRERTSATMDGTGATLDVSVLEAGMYFLRLGNQSAKIEIAR